MARQIEELILQVGIDDRRAKKSVKGLDKGFNKAEKSAKSLNKTLLKVGASLLTVAAGVRAVGKASDVALDFTKVGNALLTVFGTSEAVSKEWEFLNRISDTLGLNVLELSKQYTKVAAASKGTTLEGKGARDVLVGIAAASTALSLSADEAAGALRAVNQIISKGKVQAEELRGQLGERIPGAFQIAARAMNVTTSELDKMLETGKLLSTEFVPKFAAQLKKEFGGGAMAAANKEIALMNRISNDLNETWRKFGVVANSFLPVIANSVIPSITSAMESLLDTSLDYAEEVLPEIITVASGVFEGLGTLMDTFGDVAGAVFGFIGNGWALLFDEMTGSNNWVNDITVALTVAAKAWPELMANAFLSIAKVVFETLGGVQKFFSNLIDDLVLETFGLAVISGQITQDELNSEAVDRHEKRIARASESNFFDDFAAGFQREIDKNNETFEIIAEQASENRAEEKKGFSELINDLRKNIKNTFDLDDLKRSRDIDRRGKAADKDSKAKKFKVEAPQQSAFEVGTAAASEFLKASAIGLQQLDVQRKIEKNTRNQKKFELVAK